MSILYYGDDGRIHRLGDLKTLLHYNHNHDALGRFAGSNAGSVRSSGSASKYEQHKGKISSKVVVQTTGNRDLSNDEKKKFLHSKQFKEAISFGSDYAVGELYRIYQDRVNDDTWRTIVGEDYHLPKGLTREQYEKNNVEIDQIYFDDDEITLFYTDNRTSQLDYPQETYMVVYDKNKKKIDYENSQYYR